MNKKLPTTDTEKSIQELYSENPNLVTIQKAANALKVSKDTLRRWEAKGKITSIRTTSGYRLYDLKTLSKAAKSKSNAEVSKPEVVSKTIIPPFNQQTPLIPEVKTAAHSFYEFANLNPQIVQLPSHQSNTKSDSVKKVSASKQFSQSSLPQAVSKQGLRFYTVIALLLLTLLGTVSAAYVYLPGVNQSAPAKYIAGLIKKDINSIKPSREVAITQSKSEVLAASSIAKEGKFLQLNLDTNIVGNLAVEGEGVFTENITAPNILYSLNPGTNITITGDPQNPTISTSLALEDATYTTKGIASFSSTFFTVTDGAVTIADGSLTGDQIDDGTVTNSNLANSSITINAGSGLSGGGTVSLGGSITLTASGGSVSGVSTITGTADQVIASASTGDITLSLPQSIGTTSDVEFDSLELTTGLLLNGSTSGTITVAAPATVTSYTLSLPSDDGTNGYVLQTDGSGNTSWVAQSGGASSLQDAYDGGNTIATTTGRNLAFTLSSGLATSTSLTLTNAGTASAFVLNDTNGATNTSIEVQSGGSPTLTITEAGTLATSGNISTSGSGTITSAGTLTASNGLTMATGALSLTSTSGSISSTGLSGLTYTLSSGTAAITAPTLNLNTSSTGNTAIGNATGTFSLTSSGLNVSTGGTITGATWNGTAISTQYGGTGQNFSATAQGSLPYFSATGTFSALAPSTAGYVLTTQGAGADPTWTDTGSLTVRWNTIDDPNGNQTLAMADYTTTWNWATADTETAFSATANALTSGTLFNLSSTSTAGAGSGNSFLLDLSRSGTNSNASHTAYGIRSQVTNTGTTSTNIAGYFSASGATTNYALYAPSGYSYFGGSVGIGSDAPSQTSKLAVVTTGLATTLDVTNNNTGSTAYGARITKSGAATTGVGLYVTSSGATNNYAAIFDAGRVGIGDTTPDSLFDFEGAISGTPSSTGAWLNYTGSTFTDSATSGSGTATTFAANAFGQPTLAATNSNVTTTNAATLYIANAPATGSNQTITAPLALLVDNGAARFDGHVGIGSGYNNAAVSSTSVLGISEAYTGSSSFRHVNLFGSHAPASDNSNTQYAFASVLDLHSSATASLTGTVTAGLFQITNSNATQSIGTAFGSWIGTATSSGGAITNNYGLFIDDQTVGSSDYGLRIDAADTQTLWVGGGANGTTASAGIAFGSSRDTNLYRSAADTLKTDDAFTATGLITGSAGLTITGGTASINASGSSSTTIGNTSSDLTLTGNHINASMTLTDTSSGAKNGLSSTISLNPSGSSASQFRANSFSATVSSGNVQNFTDVIRGVYAETRHLGTGSINTATGVFSAGVVLPTAATSFGTITEINAFHALPVSEFASSAITGTVSTARGIYIENSAKANSSWTMTTQVGIDVSAMTSGSSDIGVRIAGADTYSLQLSSTAGTAASGITFGTDTNLYRSAADTLKTDDALTVSGLLTGSAGSTISGGTINLNASSNNPTNINTGTSTGAISIGNSSAGAIALSTGSTFGVTTTTGSQTFTSANVTGTTTSSSYVFNSSSLTSGTALYVSSTATSGKTVDINASQTSGTVFNLAYGSAKTLTGDLTGLSVDLNSGNVDATNQNITGVNFKIPTVTDTHTSGTKTLTGMLVNFGSGAGINQNGAGGTLEYVAGDFYMPALTQTAGTLNAYGTRVTTPATITTGGTAYGNYVSATGVGAGTLSGLGISSITGGAGTEYALNIGSGWDAVLRVGSTTVINGSGVTVEAGGGTGQSTYTTGDLLYASGANTLSKRAIGNDNDVLTVVAGVPTWAPSAGGTCSNCVITDPTSDQTIAPTGQGTTGLIVRQTSTASPTDDIFQITSSDGATKYFYVDKDGNVSTSSTSGQTLTLTPLTDTTALTLVGTNVTSQPLQYVNSNNESATSGIINMAYGSAQTLTGSVIGIRTDLSTNVTATNQSVTGYQITLPGATNTSGTQAYKGIVISGGSINENGGTATTFTGADITIPALTQTSGTLTAYGANITTPSSITTAGTAYGVNIAATGVGAGSLYGVNVSDISAGAGTEVGMQIGSGWDTNLLFNDTTTRVAVADGGTITILDTAGNSLCTITDNGSVGDLECTGSIGGSGTVGFWSRDAGTGIVSPSNANDVVAISSNKTSTPLLNLTSTGATSNAFTLTGNSITTGNLASLTGTGFTTGEILDITGTWAPSDGSNNEAIDINITHSPTSVADTFKGIELSVVDNSSLSNLFYGGIFSATSSVSGAKTLYGLQGGFGSSSTTADTLNSVFAYGSATGAISTGTRQIRGFTTSGLASTAASTGGTLNMYGGYFNPSSTGSNPGTSDTATNNVYGIYTAPTLTLASDCTTNCTSNQYGLYVDNGSSDTDGTSTKYGIYISTQSGADTNYALYSAATAASYFAGNVGIGTTPSGAYRAQVSRSITSSDNSYDGNLSASATVSSVTDGYTYVGLNNYLTSTHSSNAATLRGIDAKAYFSSQMASEATVGVNSAYAIYAEKGITGSSPTGTISNAFGLHSAFYSSATGTPAVTISNNYGLYITNQGTPSGSPSGISVGNAIGLYVAAQSGATSTNYAAVFAGGNVGIGDTSPASALTVGSGDLFQVNSSGAIAAVTGYTQASGAFAFSGGGNFSIDSAAFDVNTSGAISGVTTLTQSGLHTINQGSAIRSIDINDTAASPSTPVIDVNRTNNTGTPAITNAALYINDHSTNYLLGFETGTTDLLTFTGAGQLSLPVSGSGAGIILGGDANLYRSAADTLRTDDAFNVGGNFNVTAAGVISGATGLTSSGTINFSGLSASSGVYTDSSKNLTSTPPSSGTIGYWSRSGTALSPATAGDVVLLDNNTAYQMKDTGGVARSLVSLNSSDMQTFGVGAYNSTYNGYRVDITSALPLGQTTDSAFDIKSSNDLGSSDELVQFGDSAGDFLTILGGGNVGIGTTAPSSLLSLGNSTANTKLALYDDGVNIYGLGVQSNQMRFHVYNPAADFVFYDAPAGNALFTIDGGGNVGVGDASPAALFTVGSGDLFQVNSSGNIANIGGAAHTIANSAGALGIDSATTGAINIGTSANTKTITVGNSTGATALAFTSGTGSQTFTSSVATTSTTSSAFVFTANSLTSGTGAYINSTSLTTGKLFQLSTGAANTLSSGTLADIRTTSTALTGSTGTGSLLNLDWSPGSSTTATGDLFALNIGTNGSTTGKLFNILDASSSIFSVSETSFTTSLPSNFTAAGDTSIAYDINFTNPTASYIKSVAPLYMVAGETFNSSNLTLGTYNQGTIVFQTNNTTTTAVDLTSSTLTTGTGLNISGSALTSGYGLSVNSTATAFTGSLGIFTLSGSNAANTGTVLEVANTGTSNTNTALYIKHYATGTGNFAFRIDDVSGDTTPIVVDGAGSLGLGTTTPNAKLSFANNVGTGYLDAYSDYQMLLWDAGSAATAYGVGIISNTMVFNSGAGGFNFDRAGSATAMSIDTNGNLLVGASSASTKVTINGPQNTALTILNSDATRGVALGANGTAGTGTVYLNSTSGGYGMTFGIDSSEKMRIHTDGNVGIGGIDTTPDALLELETSATTTDMLTVTASSLTTGSALTLVGPTGTGVTDHFVKVSSDVGANSVLMYLNPDFNHSSGTGYGLNITSTNSTANAVTDYALFTDLALTGNAGKTGYAARAFVSSTSTTGNALYGGDFLADHNAAVTTGNTTLYGVRGRAYNDGITDTNAATIYGGLFEAAGNTGGTNSVAIGVYSIATGADFNHAFYNGAAFVTANTAGLCWDNSGESAIYDCNGAPTDLAENYGTSDSSIEAGDVVAFTGEAQEVLDPREGKVTTKAYVKKSTAQYQNDLVGIVSTNPNQTYGEDGLFSPEENPRPISLTGRVPVKVSTENGPIAAGDYLTSSSIPGVAMKSTQPGVTIGRALSSYNSSGVGKVIVYVKTGFADPNEALANLLIGNNGQLLGSELNLQKITVATTGTFGGLVSADDYKLNAEKISRVGVLASLPVDSQNRANVSDALNLLAQAQNSQESRITDLQSKEASTAAALADAKILGEQALEQTSSLQDSVASTSATIANLSTQIEELFASLTGNSTPATPSSTPQPPTELALTPPTVMFASDSATLDTLTVQSQATISGQLTAYEGIFQNSLKSLGDTFLGRTNIAGDLSVDGTFSVSEGSTLNALPTLYFQTSALAEAVDFFSGLVTITKDGTLAAKEIVTEQISVKADSSAGQVVLPAGETEIPVLNELTATDSIIILTSETPGAPTLAVSDKVDSTGFVVKLGTPHTEDIKFSYLIVGQK